MKRRDGYHRIIPDAYFSLVESFHVFERSRRDRPFKVSKRKKKKKEISSRFIPSPPPRPNRRRVTCSCTRKRVNGKLLLPLLLLLLLLILLRGSSVYPSICEGNPNPRRRFVGSANRARAVWQDFERVSLSSSFPFFERDSLRIIDDDRLKGSHTFSYIPSTLSSVRR